MPIWWWIAFVFFGLVAWAIFTLALWITLATVVRFFARRAEQRSADRLLDIHDRYRVGL